MLKDSNRNPSVEKHDVLYQIAALESSSQLGLFACGSYELNERDGLRSGKIALCDVKGRLQAESPLGPGVLDLKWRCRDNALLAATSDGFLSVYKACARETESALRITGAIGFPEEGLFLSLSVGDSTAVVSTQEGSILSVAVADEGLRLLNQNSAAHHMLGGNVPAWIVAMNPHANNIICSGGDDMTIKLWDLRCFETPTSCISKVHSAGVTCATFSPHEEHLVAVGSYDESVNFWDVRNMIKPLSSVKTGKKNSYSDNFYFCCETLKFRLLKFRWRCLAYKISPLLCICNALCLHAQWNLYYSVFLKWVRVSDDK